MSGYISELYTFFEELSENNDRAWFAANRDRYDMLRESWLADLDRMIGAMSAWDPALRTQTARGCAYRIYRDTRFSPDKTPFKLFFSASSSFTIPPFCLKFLNVCDVTQHDVAQVIGGKGGDEVSGSLTLPCSQNCATPWWTISRNSPK